MSQASNGVIGSNKHGVSVKSFSEVLMIKIIFAMIWALFMYFCGPWLFTGR